MSDYKVTDAELISVANTIRTKGGTSASLSWPDGFVSAISDISSGGITPSGSISISANGTYDVTSFTNAVVDVPTGGGSNDNFKIAVRAISGSIYDNETSTIGNIAFYNNSMITDANMLSVLGIGSSAFHGCSNLSTANFPECTSIGDFAFRSCKSLTAMSFPKCTGIGSSAFQGCSNLSTANFPECTGIGGYAFQGCNNLSTVSFPKCTGIGSSAFQGCSNLSTANFPECTSIGSYAFQYCSNLSTANFPECTGIGSYAFQGCINLSTANFPECTGIGSSAFQGCSNLESVYLTVNSVVGFGSNMFKSTPMVGSTYLGRFGSIYVPSDLVDAYKSANGWSSIADRITAYTE